MTNFPEFIEKTLERVHSSWIPVLRNGLAAIARQSPDYLETLADDVFLPTGNRLFAAFSQPMDAVRYVLVGEGPYPRAESASGYCFMDAAVTDLWSENGLSKPVNRATSLRNFIKMLWVAEGKVAPDNTGGEAMKAVARQALAKGAPYIRTLDEMQETMLEKGFLLLNAALVYRQHVPAAREARTWQPFFHVVLEALASASRNRQEKIVLVLWGKMAEKLLSLPLADSFDCKVSEHPYNLSFIGNRTMQSLFWPMALLYRQGKRPDSQNGVN